MESSEFPQEERRPTPPNKKTKKKKRTMGLVAFCAVIAAIVFLILVATITFLAYRGKAVTGTHLDLPAYIHYYPVCQKSEEGLRSRKLASCASGAAGLRRSNVSLRLHFQ